VYFECKNSAPVYDSQPTNNSRSFQPPTNTARERAQHIQSRTHVTPMDYQALLAELGQREESEHTEVKRCASSAQASAAACRYTPAEVYTHLCLDYPTLTAVHVTTLATHLRQLVSSPPSPAASPSSAVGDRIAPELVVAFRPHPVLWRNLLEGPTTASELAELSVTAASTSTASQRDNAAPAEVRPAAAKTEEKEPTDTDGDAVVDAARKRYVDGGEESVRRAAARTVLQAAYSELAIVYFLCVLPALFR
jgi:hypothetical protein